MPMQSAALAFIACLVAVPPIYIVTSRKQAAPPVRGPREKMVWRAVPENCAGDCLPNDVPTLQAYAISMQRLYPAERRQDACTVCGLNSCEVNRFYHRHLLVNERIDWPKTILLGLVFRHPHVSYSFDDFAFTTAHAFCPDCLWRVKLRRGLVFIFELLASLMVIAAALAALVFGLTLFWGGPNLTRLEALLWLGTSVLFGWFGFEGRWWADQWRYPPVIRIIGRDPLKLKYVENPARRGK